jgi:hypothetical protein
MSDESKTAYCAVMRDASVAGKTLMICKGQDSFPTNSERMTGFIDVWWVFDILPARGLLLLIPYLLRYSKVRAWDSRALSPLRCLHSSSSSSPPCLCVEWEAERNGSAVCRVRQVPRPRALREDATLRPVCLTRGANIANILAKG